MGGRPIGVLGAGGQVGGHLTTWLQQAGVGPLRLGVRRKAALEQMSASGVQDVQAFDLYDDRALAAFCRGCRLVVNCAGPSYQVLDRVARAAALAGAHYIDVSGDGPAHSLLQGFARPDGWIAVFSAGMLPGLANLVPAALSEQLGGALTVYSGGAEKLGDPPAADLVLSLQPDSRLTASSYWYGEAGASWRLGRRQSRSLTGTEDIRIDFFPGLVSTLPYLSADAERLALRRELTTLRWFNVFSGERLRETLIRLRGRSFVLAEAVREVERACDLDLLGRTPYYSMVFELEPPRGPARRAAITTDSSLALTAATAAATVFQVFEERIPPGLHFADDVLSPAGTLATVQRLHAGTICCQHDFVPGLAEEGAL